MLQAVAVKAGSRATWGSNFIEANGKHAHCSGHGYLIMHDSTYLNIQHLATIEEALQAFGL